MMKSRSGVILLMFISIWGCSTANDSSIVLDAAGRHPAAWIVAATGGSHPAAYLSAPDICNECHGSDLTGGISSVSCFSNSRNGISCHPQGPSGHPSGWSDPASHGAHAKAAASGANGMAFCTGCHGSDFRGAGSPQKDCLRCHTTAPHPAAANWRSTGAITHTDSSLDNAPECATCHNTSTPNLASPNLGRFTNSPAGSFNGGSPDCFTASMCHGDVRKTVNCDACHSIATTVPFKSLAGATATSDAKTGAHVKHLNASAQIPAYSLNVACAECHVVPGSPAVSGTHRNGSNDLVFGTVAKTGPLTPVYTVATGACANTYCHGATLTGGGSNKSPVWNQSGYLAAGCATCHGYPPATVRNGAASHSTSSACSGCHPHVNAANNGFTTAGTALHINGSVDAEGAGHGGAPYPGSSHRGISTSGCFGCHPANAAGSSYPAISGTPPNCRACHLAADPSTDPHCSDCHGDAATGRPNLASVLAVDYPKRQGQHRNGTSKHSNLACTVCHPFTSGDTRHGWSNRQKSVSVQIKTTIGWSAATKTCNNSCHGTERWY